MAEPPNELTSYFVDRCWQGLEARGLAQQDNYRRQLELEIDLITRLNFSGYFLVVADMVAWARSQGIAVGPGRGSAAGSLVAYSLGITDVDPLKYRLYFERFLNPERISPPDIDVDFASSRRDEVLDYLRQRYGEGRVAQIATFGKLFAKQAIRDTGRVLDLPYAEVDKIAKLVPPPLMGKQVYLSQAYEVVPELRQLRQEGHQLLVLAEKLEGLEKTLSVHAAGVVISKEPLLDCLPLAQAKGTMVTQFDMKDLDELGFVKFDILALKNLDVIMDCVALVKQHRGFDLDWRRLPEQEDPAVYDYLKEGRFGGIFQLEATSGMRELILEMQPRSIEDLSAALALFRPGPLGSGMVDHYLKVRQGKEPLTFLVPELEPILGVTYGQLIYQEQVLEICRQLAGYSLAEADLMRRAIGKKIQEEMEAQRQRFVQGMLANGFTQEVAEQLFSQIETYAGYGFNKSHSVAYAFITYITAHLKTHYRLEFYTALLNNTKEANERHKLFTYLLELREEGYRLLPPDINLSQVDFSLETDGIRYGLSGIHQVGEAVAHHLVQAREMAGGHFANLRELVEAVNPQQVNVKVLEALALAGCFDAFGGNRRTLAENCRPFLEMVRKLNRKAPAIRARRERDRERAMALAEQRPKEHGGAKLEAKLEKIEARFQKEMMDLNQEYEEILGSLEHKEPYTQQEILRLEKEYLGFYLSGHPIDSYRQVIRAKQALLVTEALQLQSTAQIVRVAGVINNLKSRMTRSKKVMYNFLLEDAYSVVECTVFPSTAERVATVMIDRSCVIVTGNLRRTASQGETDRLELVVSQAELLEETVVEPEPLRLVIDLQQVTQERVQELYQLLCQYPGDHPVQYGGYAQAGLLIYQSPIKTDNSQALRKALQRLSWVMIL